MCSTFLFLFFSARFVRVTAGCAGLIWITTFICRVSFKVLCILCLLLAHGVSREYLTFSSAFILPVQTSFTFMRFKGRFPYGRGIPYNESERGQINPCCIKTLYHNCVFNCINWITGGEQVTVLEWKWWATVTVARPPFQLWQVNNLIDFPWRLAGLFNAIFPV